MPKVLYDKQSRVAHVTLSRPEVLNAMDLATHEELGRVWDDFDGDDDMWVARPALRRHAAGTGVQRPAYEWEERRMHSADAIEGPRAFAEKRRPRWQDR